MDLNYQILELSKATTKVVNKRLIDADSHYPLLLSLKLMEILGYDIFAEEINFREDDKYIEIKKDESFDYLLDSSFMCTLFSIECKNWNQNLDLFEYQKEHRVFLDSLIYVRTNGIDYRFYSDKVEAHIMDENPFLEFNLTKITENQINELKKLGKNNDIYSIANPQNIFCEAKFKSGLKEIVEIELNNPLSDFAKNLQKNSVPQKTDKYIEIFGPFPNRITFDFPESYVEQFASQVCSHSLTPELKEKFFIMIHGIIYSHYMNEMVCGSSDEPF